MRVGWLRRPRRSKGTVLHVLGWVAVGLLVAVGDCLLRSRRRVINRLAVLLLSVAAAPIGGFASWIFWDFPSNVQSATDLLTTPVLLSDCLAAFASLAALSLATGVVFIVANRR